MQIAARTATKITRLIVLPLLSMLPRPALRCRQAGGTPPVLGQVPLIGLLQEKDAGPANPVPTSTGSRYKSGQSLRTPSSLPASKCDNRYLCDRHRHRRSRNRPACARSAAWIVRPDSSLRSPEGG